MSSYCIAVSPCIYCTVFENEEQTESLLLVCGSLGAVSELCWKIESSAIAQPLPSHRVISF